MKDNDLIVTEIFTTDIDISLQSKGERNLNGKDVSNWIVSIISLWLVTFYFF